MEPHHLDTIIRNSIRERRLVEFWLHGSRRVGEPHVYGEHSGMVQLLIYQVEGQSRSGRLPDWRRANVAEIREFRVLDRTFTSVPGPRSQRGWDVIYAAID
jgi:hypothetical protein